MFGTFHSFAALIDFLPREFFGGNAQHVGTSGRKFCSAELIPKVDRSGEGNLGHGVTGQMVVRVRDGRDNAAVGLLGWITEQDWPRDHVLRREELILETDGLVDGLTI